jgi:hypothetical protein
VSALLTFALANWRWILPLLLVAGIAIDDGLLRIDYADQKVTIAQKDTALKGMQAQQAENIAAAEKKVRTAMQADLDRTNALVRDLQADNDARQEKQNAAEVSVAAVPVEPVAKGCPDPMSLPVLRAFTSGLPDR